MHLYAKHQKDVKQLNSVINSYEKKLDEKVDDLISHMMNYSYKINDLTLPEIQNKKISTPNKKAKQSYGVSYRSKINKSMGSNMGLSFDGNNAQTLLSSFKNKKTRTITMKEEPNLDKSQIQKINQGRSIGKQQYRKPKLQKDKPEILSKEMRWNPFADKNAIKAHELEKGMLNLVERGKIGKNIDIITAFEKGRPVLSSHPAIFHHAEERFTQSDIEKYKQMSQFISKQIETSEDKNNWAITIPQIKNKINTPIQLTENDKNKKTESMLDQYKEPEVEEIIYLQFLHYKVIENENLKNFKRRNVEEWSQVRNLIERMEKFLKSANAQLVFVDCKQLLKHLHKCKRVKQSQLIKCIVRNKSQKLGTIMSIKNRKQKELKAVELMLSFVKRNKIRRKYMQVLLKKKIQNRIGQWIKNGKTIKDYRKNLQIHRQETFKIYAEQQEKIKNEYQQITSAKHYEIHIMNKQFMRGFKYQEIYNTEITKIFNLQNPNTHIIYICPFELSIETMNYYFKIMELQEIEGYKERVLFMEVDPDHRLPSNLTASAKLFYNSRSLRKLQRKIKGVPSYLVSSYPSEIDINLSVFLKIPIFSGNLQYIKTHRSCIQSQFDIETLPSLKIEPKKTNILSLSNSIIKFCQTSKRHNKYVIKLNQKFGSSGLALLQYPFCSLPQMYSNTTLVQPFYFKSIDRFYAYLIKKGGIIQRYEEGIQAISVYLKIHTDGNYTVMGTFDKISSGLVNVAYLFPQKSVNHKILVEKTKNVTQKLIKLGHIGDTEITFFKDIHENLFLQNVQPYSTKIGSSLTYFKFLAGGYFNNMGEFMTKITDQFQEENGGGQDDITSMESRGYCYIPFLLHFGLSQKQIASFFQLCRIGGVSFDLQNKYGSTFLLLGSMKSSLGVITTAKDRKGIIKVMSKTLDFLIKQNSHNISDEMLKEKQIRSKERYNILAIKQRLQSLL